MFKALYSCFLVFLGVVISFVNYTEAQGPFNEMPDVVYGPPPDWAPSEPSLWQRMIEPLYVLPRIVYILLVPLILLVGALVYMHVIRRKKHK